MTLFCILLWALYGCAPKKNVHVDYIQAEFPAIQSIPRPQQEDWLSLYFSTTTPQEKKNNWSMLLNEEYSGIRTRPMIAFVNRAPDPISITGLLAHPEITNSQRCLVAFYANRNQIPFNSGLLPKKFSGMQEKLYCAITFAQARSDMTPILNVLPSAELPLDKSFYDALVLLEFDVEKMALIFEEKLRGEEDSFTYLSLYCSWFLIDPQRVAKPLIKHLLDAPEDDRLEAMEFLWGKREALPIFQSLSNSESYSGVYAQLGVTACGGENIDFTLMYINEGATWNLRLLGLEAMGLWYARNINHKKRNKVRKELISLLETQNDEVYIHLLRALRVSKLQESITLILEKPSQSPIVQMERAATLRTLTSQIQ